MDKPITRRDLLEVLDLWGNAFETRIDARIDAKLDAKLGELRIALSAEFAQHADRVLDEARKFTASLDDKYKDLRARVDALEAHDEALTARVAALETTTPPPRRQRRR